MSEETNKDLALSVAKKSMKIVIFIGMFAVVLLMINIYVMMTQITASAQLSRKLHAIERSLGLDVDSSVAQGSHKEREK